MLDIPHNLTYDAPIIDTPNKKNVKLIFADDTATGRPCPIIEQIVVDRILPFYSNTHSNATAGHLMSSCIEKTKHYIKEYYNLSEDYCIIFDGSGSTGSFNHFVNIIDTTKHKKINIYISIYEHHSNYLPWYELSKKCSNVILHVIKVDKNGENQFGWLRNELSNNSNPSYLNIVSLTACSNVTGLYVDIETIKLMIAQYNSNTLLLFDCACIAPYEKINGENIDAMFISGHKFLGGHSTPGILIAKKKLFEKETPYCTGGGCVKYATEKSVAYNENIETRESAGTPNIVGIAKLFYVYKLQFMLMKYIVANNKTIINYVDKKMLDLMKKYDIFKVIFLTETTKRKLPIYSFAITGLTYTKIVELLNNYYGIQSRGGLSCCGLLGQYIYEKYNINGWTRITFSWKMDMETIDFILLAIENIITNKL